MANRIHKLYTRYLRTESFRKSLVYQKKYLLLLLGGFQVKVDPHPRFQTSFSSMNRLATGDIISKRLGFDSWAGQIKHSVATAAMYFRSCVAQALSSGDGTTTRYTLRRNIARIMKI